MNTKILTTFILSAILLTTFVAAEVYEPNYLFDGETGNELTDVSVIMYTCQDTECNTATRLWENTMSTEDNNLIRLTYPTVLVSEFGYTVYYFKPGYVPTTRFGVDWAGNGNTEDYDFFLYKIADTAYAPIEHFEADDTTAKVNQEITITAEVLSPRLNSNDIEFIPEELIENYYSDEVEVSLQVDGETVETKTLNMLWSTEQDIEFTWTPLEEGDYTIQIITEITDNKFLDTETDETQEIEIQVKGTQDPEEPNDEDKDNNYSTGYRNINQYDTTEDDAYLNQYNPIIPTDDEAQESTNLSAWTKFINWFNNLFYKVFWFLDN